MVKTSSAKPLSVKCPNGNEAQKVGELYFCDSLALPKPTIAYLGGKECGRADFSEITSKVAPTSGIKCTVLLAPARITKGQSSQVTIQLYTSGSNDVLTYNCGDKEISEKVAGFVTTGKNCRFDIPGTIEIAARVNGELCGSKLLEVFEKPKDCSVLSSNFSKSGQTYAYTAQVAARGYSGNDELRYKCYGVQHVIKLEKMANSADFTTTIDCSSKEGPLSAPVDVYVNTDYCGQLVPPES